MGNLCGKNGDVQRTPPNPNAGEEQEGVSEASASYPPGPRPLGSPALVWLTELGLAQYGPAFEASGFGDWQVLGLLEERDLDMIEQHSNCSILPGHRKKLLLASKQMGLGRVSRPSRWGRVSTNSLARQSKSGGLAVIHHPAVPGPAHDSAQSSGRSLAKQRGSQSMRNMDGDAIDPLLHDLLNVRRSLSTGASDARGAGPPGDACPQPHVWHAGSGKLNPNGFHPGDPTSELGAAAGDARMSPSGRKRWGQPSPAPPLKVIHSGSLALSSNSDSMGARGTPPTGLATPPGAILSPKSRQAPGWCGGAVDSGRNPAFADIAGRRPGDPYQPPLMRHMSADRDSLSARPQLQPHMGHNTLQRMSTADAHAHAHAQGTPGGVGAAWASLPQSGPGPRSGPQGGRYHGGGVGGDAPLSAYGPPGRGYQAMAAQQPGPSPHSAPHLHGAPAPNSASPWNQDTALCIKGMRVEPGARPRPPTPPAVSPSVPALRSNTGDVLCAEGGSAHGSRMRSRSSLNPHALHTAHSISSSTASRPISPQDSVISDSNSKAPRVVKGQSAVGLSSGSIGSPRLTRQSSSVLAGLPGAASNCNSHVASPVVTRTQPTPNASPGSACTSAHGPTLLRNTSLAWSGTDDAPGTGASRASHQTPTYLCLPPQAAHPSLQQLVPPNSSRRSRPYGGQHGAGMDNGGAVSAPLSGSAWAKFATGGGSPEDLPTLHGGMGLHGPLSTAGPSMSGEGGRGPAPYDEMATDSTELVAGWLYGTDHKSGENAAGMQIGAESGGGEALPPGMLSTLTNLPQPLLMGPPQQLRGAHANGGHAHAQAPHLSRGDTEWSGSGFDSVALALAPRSNVNQGIHSPSFSGRRGLLRAPAVPESPAPGAGAGAGSVKDRLQGAMVERTEGKQDFLLGKPGHKELVLPEPTSDMGSAPRVSGPIPSIHSQLWATLAGGMGDVASAATSAATGAALGQQSSSVSGLSSLPGRGSNSSPGASQPTPYVCAKTPMWTVADAMHHALTQDELAKANGANWEGWKLNVNSTSGTGGSTLDGRPMSAPGQRQLMSPSPSSSPVFPFAPKKLPSPMSPKQEGRALAVKVAAVMAKLSASLTAGCGMPVSEGQSTSGCASQPSQILLHRDPERAQIAAEMESKRQELAELHTELVSRLDSLDRLMHPGVPHLIVGPSTSQAGEKVASSPKLSSVGSRLASMLGGLRRSSSHAGLNGLVNQHHLASPRHKSSSNSPLPALAGLVGKSQPISPLTSTSQHQVLVGGVAPSTHAAGGSGDGGGGGGSGADLLAMSSMLLDPTSALAEVEARIQTKLAELERLQLQHSTGRRLGQLASSSNPGSHIPSRLSHHNLRGCVSGKPSILGSRVCCPELGEGAALVGQGAGAAPPHSASPALAAHMVSSNIIVSSSTAAESAPLFWAPSGSLAVATPAAAALGGSLASHGPARSSDPADRDPPSQSASIKKRSMPDMEREGDRALSSAGGAGDVESHITSVLTARRKSSKRAMVDSSPSVPYHVHPLDQPVQEPHPWAPTAAASDGADSRSGEGSTGGAAGGGDAQGGAQQVEGHLQPGFHKVSQGRPAHPPDPSKPREAKGVAVAAAAGVGADLMDIEASIGVRIQQISRQLAPGK